MGDEQYDPLRNLVSRTRVKDHHDHAQAEEPSGPHRVVILRFCWMNVVRGQGAQRSRAPLSAAYGASKMSGKHEILE
jgi:hypothetical protein